MFKLLIVDDEPIVRLGLKTTIDWEKNDVSVVGEAQNGKNGLEKALSLKPDIIITDIKMPVMNGLEMIRKIRDANLPCHFIVLSGYGEFEYAKTALENRVISYLLKPVSNEELIKTIKKAIDDIKKEKKIKSSIEIINSSKEDLKRKLIRMLIKKIYASVEDLKKEVEFVNYELIDNGVVLIGIINEEKDDVTNELTLFQTLLTNALKNEGIKYIDGIYHQRATFIIDINDRYRLEEICSQVLKEFKTQCKLTISIGISNIFSSLDYIPEAYENSKSVASNGLLNFVNSIQIYHDDGKLYSQNLIKALNVIHRDYMKNIGVEYVADALKVSESYLMHMFKKELDTTFNKVLMDVRIKEAKKLLKSGEYRVKEVAYQVGFNDEKYFAMVFKKLVKMTPSMYAKQYEKKA